MKNKKWFTLIEMLIVIVIIGILAAAIIPRLNSARGRANDVARKADINQVATALITYQLDNWKFPATSGSIDNIETYLLEWGMTSIPKDPADSEAFSWVVGSNTNKWYYLYTPIKKNWIPNWWFVLMAKMESQWQANYLVCTGSQINTYWDYTDINLCTKITYKKSNNPDGCDMTDLSDCKSNDLSQLRYIYKY